MDLTNKGQKVQINSDGNGSKQPDFSNSKKNVKFPHRSKLLKIFQVGLLICVAVLVAGILLSIATYKKSNEDNYVDSSKYQAVFLNGGQVYFGKITALNKSYLTLSDIYYLRVTQQVQPGQKNQQNNFALAKLGCELHRPTNVMVVNKDQVVFWENLKDESAENTVTGAIKKYAATNNGVQDCDQQNSTNGSTNSTTPTDTTTDTTNATDGTTNNTTDTTTTPDTTNNNQ